MIFNILEVLFCPLENSFCCYRVTQLVVRRGLFVNSQSRQSWAILKMKISFFQTFKSSSTALRHTEYLASHSSWKIIYYVFVLMGPVKFSTCQQHPCVTCFSEERVDRQILLHTLCRPRLSLVSDGSCHS